MLLVKIIEWIEIIWGLGFVLYGVDVFVGVINVIIMGVEDLEIIVVSIVGGSFDIVCFIFK